MSVLHCIQLLIVYSCVETFSPVLRKRMELSETIFLLLMLAFTGLYALFVYNKKRWEGYIDEFKNETQKQRKRGAILLLTYTIGTLVFSFAAAIILGVYFW